MTNPVIPLTAAGQPPGAPPVFQRIGIIGLGLMGGSIALAARGIWPAGLVIGVDRNEVLERAVARHAIDVAASDLTIVREADLVILAAPVLQNIEILHRLPDYVDKPVIVTDVGSTKRAIARAAATLPPRFTFVGGHPLAGSTHSGIEAARPDLFAGRPWLFTRAGGEAAGEPREEALRRLLQFVRALGAAPHVVDPEAHDRLVAFISHLPQLAASALMQAVGDAAGAEGLALAGRGLIDTTRLAGSPAEMWADICSSNADEIGPAIDTLVSLLRQVRLGLQDREAIARFFDAARRWREALVGVDRR
jgi:prephenate dehydrogenase